MTDSLHRELGRRPSWVPALVKKQPEVPWMGPYMVYLVILALNDRFPEPYMWMPIVLRGVGGLWAFWLVRPYLPSLGRPYVGLAIVLGILSAGVWVLGQHLFNAIGLGGSFFDYFKGDFARAAASSPREGLSDAAWWSQAVTRIAVATITVPVVEELFWRGFLLRALIDWNRFEEIPLGRFTWFSFLGTALLSILQHPANWGVSIVLWMIWNALFYWKRSLLFMMIVHGVTNLVLYIYVIRAGDWQFW